MEFIKKWGGLLFLGLIISCSKSDNEATQEPTVKDVYTCGYEFNGTRNVAKYWKNGTAINLSNGTRQASAKSIVVSGDEVYVAGDEANAENTTYIAKYWKNGTAINLTDGTKNATATSIRIVGTDVYVAGDDGEGANFIAKYWKNGIATSLTAGVNYAFATSIFVK